MRKRKEGRALELGRKPYLVSFALVALLLSGRSLAETPRDTRIDEIFTAISGRSPGCSASVRRGDATLHEAGYGLASIELGVTNKVETVFHAGSIAKQFTAVATLMLAEEKVISLPDSIRKYVPELPRWADGITLQHLLHHTGGIRDVDELQWLAGGKDDARMTQALMLDVLARQTGVNFPPGEQFLYSNTAYTLLGLVVARASGEPFPTFMRRRIFEPLGMVDTTFRSDYSSLIPNRATGYRRDGRTSWHLGVYLSDLVGGGGLFTTVRDLQRWHDNFSSGAVAGSELLAVAAAEGRTAAGAGTGWGMGLRLESYRGERTVGHEGRDFGYQSEAVRFPDLDLSIAVLCNARDHDAYSFARRIASLYLPDAPVSAASPPPRTLDTPEDLARYTGIFWSPTTLGVRTVEIRDGSLVWTRGAGTVLEPIGPGRFRFQGQSAELLFPGENEMHILNPGRPAFVYERVSPVDADPLTAYTGRYRSHELEVEYDVTVATEGRLHFRAGPAFWFYAVPVFRDTFQIDEGMLVFFRRNGQGAVDGMTVSTNRARNVAFARVPRERLRPGSAAYNRSSRPDTEMLPTTWLQWP